MLKTIDEIWSKIFLKRPILEEIFKENGEMSLLEYAVSYSQNKTTVPAERKSDFITTLAKQTERLLGADKALSVSRQLEKYYYASTADHHGPICHPFFTHSDLVGALGTPEQENFIVIATSNVSLNNSSYPRGVIFNSLKSNSYKFSFFPGRERHSPVFGHQSYSLKAVKKLEELLNTSLRGKVSKKRIRVISEIYQNSGVLSLKSYSDQITKTNYVLWKNFFGGEVELPDLIYLNEEELVISLLVAHHLENKTEIHKILFDERYLDMVEDLFQEIPGAFSSKQNKGTFLFWGYDKVLKQRIRLLRQKDFLVSADSNYKIHLDPESLRIALSEGSLIPNTMLSLILISCYYGLKALGGFSQTTYLTLMAENYKKMFPGQCFAADTKALGGDLIFATLSSSNAKYGIAASGLDFVLYGNKESYEIFLQLAKQKTLKETMDLIAPTLYKILYPTEDFTWPQGFYNKDLQINSGVIKPVIQYEQNRI